MFANAVMNNTALPAASGKRLSTVTHCGDSEATGACRRNMDAQQVR